MTGDAWRSLMTMWGRPKVMRRACESLRAKGHGLSLGPEAASWPVVHARIAQTRCGDHMMPHGRPSRWPKKELEERSWRPP